MYWSLHYIHTYFSFSICPPSTLICFWPFRTLKKHDSYDYFCIMQVSIYLKRHSVSQLCAHKARGRPAPPLPSHFFLFQFVDIGAKASTGAYLCAFLSHFHMNLGTCFYSSCITVWNCANHKSFQHSNTYQVYFLGDNCWLTGSAVG